MDFETDFEKVLSNILREKIIEHYGRKHLIQHLVAADMWEEIEALVDNPIYGEQARICLAQKKNLT